MARRLKYLIDLLAGKITEKMMLIKESEYSLKVWPNATNYSMSFNKIKGDSKKPKLRPKTHLVSTKISLLKSK